MREWFDPQQQSLSLEQIQLENPDVQNSTTYFQHTSVELRTIVSVNEGRGLGASDGVRIQLDRPLSYTHLCETSYDEVFCGYVGLLTRSVTIGGVDDASHPQLSADYGHGARIFIHNNRNNANQTETALWYRRQLELRGVTLRNMGDASFDDNDADDDLCGGGISFLSGKGNEGGDTSTDSGMFLTNNTLNLNNISNSGNIISHCSFINTFNTAIYCRDNNDSNLHHRHHELVINANVFYSVWTGAVSIDSACYHSHISYNLVTGHLAPPSQFVQTLVVDNSFNQPVTAFSIYAMDGVFIGNKVAGSVENAFAIIQTYFIQQTMDLQYPIDLCNVTYSTRMNATDIDRLTMATRADSRTSSGGDGIRSKAMRMNEAVASSVGLTVVALTAHDVDIYEAANLNCGFIHNFKLWRNDHVGVLAMDLSTELVVFQTVMAENTIGVSLNIYSPHKYDFFIGVIMSKVIGIIGSDHFNTTSPLGVSKAFQTNECQSLTDTKWPDKYSDTRQNILAAFSYSRVGLMTPQFLNAPQTCTFLHGRACRVPYAIRDACMMPFEKRYGLPVSLQYSETHIYGNLFAGFCRRYNNTKSSDTVGTKSAVAVYKSVAISLNPSQIDRFSTLVLSHNSFIVNNCINSTACSTNTTFSPVSHVMTAFDIFAFRDASQAYSGAVCEGTDCLHRSPQAVLVDLDGSTLRAFESVNDTFSSPPAVSNLTSLVSGQIVFNDGQSFEAPTQRCRILTGSDPLLDLFTYCPSNQLTDDYLVSVLIKNQARYNSSSIDESDRFLNVSLSTPITFHNASTSNTDTVTTPYASFAVYKAQWDDHNPIIYPFFRVLAHPADAKLLTLPVTANITGERTISATSGGIGFYEGRPVYDFYDNGEKQVILSDDDSCCHNQHRHLQTSSFQYVSFAPAYEECSAKILYNRNKLDFADGYVHYLYLLGNAPFEWVLRWNAPSLNNLAIIKIVFQNSYRFGYNVFVCDFPFIDNNVEEMKIQGKSCTYVPSLTNPIQDIHDPYSAENSTISSASHNDSSLTDEAGTNYRDFDKSTLSLVLRGGSENRFYTVRKVPMLFLVFEVTFENNNNNWSKILQGKALLATLLGLDMNAQFMVSSVAQLSQLTRYLDSPDGGVFSSFPFSSPLTITASTSFFFGSLSTSGSSIFKNTSNFTQVTYAITPSAALYAGDRSLQVSELTAIYKIVSEDLLPTGLFQSRWLNVAVRQAFAHIPVVSETIDEVAVDELRVHVPSYDVAALRKNMTTHNIGLTSFMKVDSAINTPSNSPTPQAPGLFTHHHHHYIQSASIALAMLLTAAVVFTAIFLYRYLRHRRQQLSTLATYADFDVFVLLARFQVQEFDELIRDFTDGIEKVIDVLFTPDMGSTSNYIHSNLIKGHQQLQTPEAVTETSLMMMALIKKSVVLDTLNVQRLLTIIRTKSKQCRENWRQSQAKNLLCAESYGTKTDFSSYGCFSASVVIPHGGQLHKEVHSIQESKECHSVNGDGWQQSQQANYTASSVESKVDDSHKELQEEEEKEKASILRVCESNSLPQLKLIVSLIYSYYKHKLHQLKKKIKFTSSTKIPQRRRRSEMKEPSIVSTSLATDAATLRSQLNLIHATVTTLIANNRFLDNPQADAAILFELRWYNKILRKFERIFGKISSDSKTMNHFVSRLSKQLFVTSKCNSSSSGVEKNKIISLIDTTVMFDIESAFTNESDYKNNGDHKADGVDDVVALFPSSPIRLYQPNTTSPITTISSSNTNNHNIVSLSPGHYINNRPTPLNLISQQQRGLQNINSQSIEGGNNSISHFGSSDVYGVNKIANRPPALAIIPRRVVETERHNQLLLALTNTQSSTAELPYQSHMSLGMSLRPLSRSVDEDGGNSDSIFSDSDPAGSEYDLSSQPPHQSSPSSASSKKSLESMPIHSQTLKSSSPSQQIQKRSLTQQELDQQLLDEYNLNNDKPASGDMNNDNDLIDDYNEDNISESGNSFNSGSDLTL